MYGAPPLSSESKLRVEPQYLLSCQLCMRIPFPQSSPVLGIMQFSNVFPTNEENAFLRLPMGWKISSYTSHLGFPFLNCFSIFPWCALYFYCCLKALLVQSRCLVHFALKITSLTHLHLFNSEVLCPLLNKEGTICL